MLVDRSRRGEEDLPRRGELTRGGFDRTQSLGELVPPVASRGWGGRDRAGASRRCPRRTTPTVAFTSSSAVAGVTPQRRRGRAVRRVDPRRPEAGAPATTAVVRRGHRRLLPARPRPPPEGEGDVRGRAPGPCRRKP